MLALDAVIYYHFFLDNGMMTTPKRWILSFVFTILIQYRYFFSFPFTVSQMECNLGNNGGIKPRYMQMCSIMLC